MNKDTTAPPTLYDVMQQVKRKTIEERLIQNDGNRKHTAHSLGISRQQLQNLIRTFDIQIPPQVKYRTGKWLEKPWDSRNE